MLLNELLLNSRENTVLDHKIHQLRQRAARKVREEPDVLAAVHLPSGISWLAAPNDRADAVAKRMGTLNRTQRQQLCNQGTVTMDHATAAGWNSWAKSIVRSELRPVLDMVADQVGATTGDLARQLDASRARISALEKEVSLLRSQLDGSVTPLKGSKNNAAA